MPEARNLLPNPNPTDTSAWKYHDAKDLRVQMLSDNRLHASDPLRVVVA